MPIKSPKDITVAKEDLIFADVEEAEGTKKRSKIELIVARNIKELKTKVQKALEIGWKPVGSPFSDGELFYLMMSAGGYK